MNKRINDLANSWRLLSLFTIPISFRKSDCYSILSTLYFIVHARTYIYLHAEYEGTIGKKRQQQFVVKEQKRGTVKRKGRRGNEIFVVESRFAPRLIELLWEWICVVHVLKRVIKASLHSLRPFLGHASLAIGFI